MSNKYDIDVSCLRYIVPFKYKGTFEEASSIIEKQKNDKIKTDEKTGEKYVDEEFLWERKKATIAGSESDLYAYVKDELRFEENGTIVLDNKVGCEWIFVGSKTSSKKNGHGIKQLYYYSEGLQNNKDNQTEIWNLPKEIKLSISDIGLCLYRNGLGFLWYEIKLPEQECDSEMLILLQNRIRELNWSKAALFWEKQVNEPRFGLVLNEKNGHKTYLSPFSFGHWVNEMISILDVTYFAERNSAYIDMVNNSMKGLCRIRKEIICQKTDEFALEDKNVQEKLPDKALLFTYGVFDNKSINATQDDKKRLTYFISKGYKPSHHVSDEVSEMIKNPFDEVFWYATQEGAAYLAWPVEDNKEVFCSYISNKVKNDYYTLYLKVLYQSYSLLIYAEKIQDEVSANATCLEKLRDSKITQLFGEIHLFLAKSMATSVSHIHHQSEFYVYLKKQLRIHDDVKSVTAGLSALESLQRELRYKEEKNRIEEERKEEKKREKEEEQKREEVEEREKKSEKKLQAIMGLLALFAIPSAFTDFNDFINAKVYNGLVTQFKLNAQMTEKVCWYIICVISLLAIVVSVKSVLVYVVWDTLKNGVKKIKKIFRKTS
ncbi:MAG: hypothetical protein II838_05195 [Lachnospiraceae bacterium]|nr:hypothetical protein [Lachnospiraceae bacterium]